MSSDGNYTRTLEEMLQRLHQGDISARERLIEHSYERLRLIARKMLRGDRVSRWEETDDLLQRSITKLFDSLKGVRPDSARGFLSLASQQMRRTLIDLARKHYGPQGIGRKHATDLPRKKGSQLPPIHENTPDDTSGPEELASWLEFHETVNELPEEERAVFDLYWYQDLKHDEVAETLGTSVRTVKRRWRASRLRLQELLGERLIDEPL